MKFLEFLFSPKGRKAEREELQREIEELEHERLKSKSSHRVSQQLKSALIEKIKEKRLELKELKVQM